MNGRMNARYEKTNKKQNAGLVRTYQVLVKIVYVIEWISRLKRIQGLNKYLYDITNTRS